MMNTNSRYKIGCFISKIFIGWRIKKIGRNTLIHWKVGIDNPKNLSIGDNSIIYPLAVLRGDGRIEIGNNCVIEHGVYIHTNKNTKFIMEDNAIIAPRAMIFTSTNYYKSGRIIRDAIKDGDVIVGEDAFIGAGSVVLPGVTISPGAIVGAGAVVTKDVSPYSIVAGVPARFIKERTQ